MRPGSTLPSNWGFDWDPTSTAVDMNQGTPPDPRNRKQRRADAKDARRKPKPKRKTP